MEHAHRLPVIRALWEELVNGWPQEAHWFCPKRRDDDPLNYDDPDASEFEVEEEHVTSAQKAKLIEEGEKRLNIAYRLFEVYLFEMVDVGEVKMGHRDRSMDLLTACDRCVRNYHMGRKPFLKEFSEHEEDDRVTELSNFMNDLDFRRMDHGLDDARSLLKKLPSMERNAKALMEDTTALTALYEALCSAPYHSSPKKLYCNFDDPFKLVQERRVLKIGDILPAMTRFLFVTDHIRLKFAKAAWRDLDRKLTQKTFDWAVHDALTDAILSVAQNAPLSEVQRFWEGLLLILHKLDVGLITHSLRAMEVQPNVYHLALQHLARYDCERILDNVIKALRVLLLKSSKDFYAAYDTISSTTIAEQIFANKAFDGLLARSQYYELVGDIEVPCALTWISPFVQSLPAAHQYEFCRSLLHHLFERFQAKNLTKASKLACFRAGLNALLTTLITFVVDEYMINASTPFIVVNNILGLVDQYRLTIVDCANLGSNTEEDKELSRLGMQVIRNALSLCSKSILAEFEALDLKQDIRHGLDSHSQSIWEAVLDGFGRDNVEMARNVLIGLQPLVGLDKLMPRRRVDKGKSVKDPLLDSKVRFNREFVQVVDVISRVFERLSDFTPTNLQPLCKRGVTAYSLFAGLTPSDQATYEAAVEVIKAITGKPARRDAIARLLQDSLAITLRSLAWATRRIRKYEAFGGVPYLIKTSRDVLDSLCNPQDGLLRTKLSPSKEEQGVIIAWWTEQWLAMGTAFQNYENWVYGTDDISYMTELCRDIMEYAEALFDQYVVLASILDTSAFMTDSEISRSELSEASRKNLLNHPCDTMRHMIKWLRLRDSYLLGTLVSLVCKVLRRLGEFNMAIDTQALREVKILITGGYPQYKVTGQQKAELLSAFEDHIGMAITGESASLDQSKQGTVDNRFKYSYGARKNPSKDSHRAIPSPSSVKDGVRSLPKPLEQEKSAVDQMRSGQVAKSSSRLSSRSTSDLPKSLKESREKAKEERARRDAGYLAQVHALRAPSGLVPGEGSGLNGIGVQGKSHEVAPREQGLMISEDEASEDDGADVKVLLKNRKEKAKKGSEQERSVKRALLQQPDGPVRKTKVVRSANDMRARLVPNMDMLHLTILRWDIFHEGDEPPTDVSFLEVSNKFQTPSEYYNTFYPLLIAEAWRALSTAKDENNFKSFEIKVVNRLSVDSFFEVGTSMPIAENRDNNLAEGDIVLLSKGQAPLKDRKEALCLSRIYRVTRKKDVLEVSYRISGQATGNAALLSALSPNLKIRGVKITSMTTIEREYAALKSLEFYDLCDEILSAKPSPLLPYPDQTFNQIKAIYGLNKGQAKAIWSARDNDAFTLIQGPPGSGKTKTIVAMVGALLTDKLTAPGVTIGHPRGAEPKVQNDMPAQKKLLICAPSNAAVDELVSRLKEGVKTLKGEFHKINVIRLGRSDAINTNVKDVTLDELVRAKMEGDGKAGLLVLSEREKLHQQAARLKESVDGLRPKLEEARTSGNTELERRLQREFDSKKRDQARIGARIEDDKSNGNTASRENEITRRRLQQEIIDSAHVICATLSGSGHEMFKNLSVEFETVIIDEAAQCIELSALIPLKYGCSKCILVGDPKQLPPTVLSKSAARYGYEQSLFVRMQQNYPSNVHLLDVQYRMHPEISKFPSKQFYDDRLIDGEDLAKLRDMPWHKSGLLGPYRFFDVKGIQTNGARGHSYVNMEEVSEALRLYNRLRSDYPSYDFRGKIGIITPYKAQLKELRQIFQRSCGEKVFDEIEFNTTDAFQGRESEIIIFSCVRARASGGIGFLEDIRRMNVGLTRAKSSLWILGNSNSLMQGEFWARLIDDAKARQLYSGGAVEQGMILKRPRAASRSEESSRRNSAEASLPEPIASVEMADAPASRRTSIASVEMADILDERESSIMSENSASRASSVAYSASRASSIAYKPKPLRFQPTPQPPTTLEPRIQKRKEVDEVRQAELKRKADELAAQEHEDEYRRLGRDPRAGVVDVTTEVFEETWFDGTSTWRLVKRGIYKVDSERMPGGRLFNPNQICNICGSDNHYSKQCGNIDMLQHSNRLCHRCKRPPYHHSRHCTLSRCLRCGKLGHREEDCGGPQVSNEKRKHIIKQEEAFERKKADRQVPPRTSSGPFDSGPARDALHDSQSKDPRNSYLDRKEASKRERSVTPTDEDDSDTMKFGMKSKDRTPAAETASSYDGTSLAVFGSTLASNIEGLGHGAAVNTEPLRPNVRGNVPPPRKKARADPLMRNRISKRP